MPLSPIPDFDRLIAEARATRQCVPISQARLFLGDFFDEHSVDQETLIIPRNGHIALTATSWMRVLHRAKAKAGRWS